MHAVVSHEMRDGECGMAVTSDRKGDRSEKGQKQPIWGVCSPVWPPGLMPHLVVIGETAPQEGRSFWQHCVVLRLRRSLGGQRFGRMSKGWQTRELGAGPAVRASEACGRGTCTRLHGQSKESTQTASQVTCHQRRKF